VVGFPAGRVLGDSILDAVVFQVPPTPAYAGSTAPDAQAPSDKQALAAAVADRVNAVRKEAGVRLLRLSPGQSATADKLTPYYFAAVTGSLSPLYADRIALGMMAGYDVGSEVREGHFSSGAYAHIDPARLLDDLAARPFGRETLFDPHAGVLAVGVMPTEDGALGATIGTYSSFEDSGTPAEEMGRVVDRLTALRKAKKLAAPRLVTELDQDARHAADRVRGGDDPKDALDGMLHDSVTRLQSGGIQGWVLQGSTIDTLPFPSELLSLPNLPLAISVAHHRSKGHPWTELLVFVVVLHMDGPSTARASKGGHG
jgi:hypothetical protein